MKYLGIFLLIFSQQYLYGQGIGINTPNPDNSAALDITATDRGLLPPRMTTTQRLAINNPAEGLMVYDTDIGCGMVFDGSDWRDMCAEGSQGNTSSNDPTTISLVYGDTIQAGDAVVIGDGRSGYLGPHQEDWDYFVVSTDMQTRLAQQFVTSEKAVGIKAVELVRQSMNSSVQFLQIACLDYQDRIDSVIAFTSAYDSRSVTASRIFMFADPINVYSSTKYAFILYANDDCRIYYNPTNPYSLGEAQTSVDSGQSWTSLGGDVAFRIYESRTKAGYVFKTDDSFVQDDVIKPNESGDCVWPCDGVKGSGDLFSKFIGFTLDSGVPGDTGTVQIMGIHDSLSNLRPGATYYLSNDRGTIAVDPDVQEVPVGKAITNEKILIQH